MDRVEAISDAQAARIDPDAPEPLVLYGYGMGTQTALDLFRGLMTDEPLSGSSQNWPHLGRSWSPRVCPPRAAISAMSRAVCSGGSAGATMRLMVMRTTASTMRRRRSSGIVGQAFPTQSAIRV